MMAIEVSCPGCLKAYRLKEELAGKTVRCPACQEVMKVPTPSNGEAWDDLTPQAMRKDGRTLGRKQRDYTHLSCGGSTTVDGPEFQALADPLAGMVATYCATCDEAFPIEQFVWTDTQEKISDYYDRYQNMGAAWQNLLVSRTGMYLLAAVPFLLGVLGFLVVKNRWCIPAGLLMGLIVIALHTVLLGPIILKQVVGTSDPRELN
jgi:hypothetical protein